MNEREYYNRNRVSKSEKVEELLQKVDDSISQIEQYMSEREIRVGILKESWKKLFSY